MSYIIPVDELTLTDQRTLRGKAVDAAVARALALKLAVVKEELVVRHAQPEADFGVAAGVAQWNTTPLAAIGTDYSIFPAAAGNPVLANNRLAVFYKVGIETAPSPVSLLSFRVGAAAGTTKAIFDLEQLVNKLETDGYFSEPVVYDPQQVMNIVVTCRILTAVFARVQLGCFIVEPLQGIIS